jgi:hypothetical protein
MGLKLEEIDAHVARWEATLRASFRSYRDKWPSRLFHHAPLENAISIIQKGCLLSRNDAKGLGAKDIAAQDIVNSREAAHRYARLYFRPRTPTQFRIEGVRKDAECYNNEKTAHAPVLIMFAFSSRALLAMPDVQFSTGNMQSGSATYGPTSEDFQNIDFSKVYHEGGIDNDKSIITARCAEVLAPSPLPLAENLQFVLCRSQAERQTLLHAIGDMADQWADIVRVSDDIQVFQKEFCYVEEVALSTKGVTFRLHPRNNPGKVEVRVEAAELGTGTVVTRFGPGELDPVPGGGKSRWIAESEQPLKPGAYLVRLWLEGHLACETVQSVEPIPF